MAVKLAPKDSRGRRYLSFAAATAFLTGAAQIRFRTVVRWAVYVAVPVVPTLVELAGWKMWQKLPLLPSFHVIYWWAVLVGAVILYESASRGRQAVRWQEFWVDRGRNLGGITEDIGELLIHRRQDGRGPSRDVIVADLLRQIVRITSDLMQPAENVKVMACVLIPSPADPREARTLNASIYNEAAGRHKSEIPKGVPSPAWEAFLSSKMCVVPDTSAETYAAQFSNREYRSVAAFAVNIGQRRGKRLAVVTLDANERNFFTEQRLRDKGIEAAIFPYLKLIGIALLADTKGRLQW